MAYRNSDKNTKFFKCPSPAMKIRVIEKRRINALQNTSLFSSVRNKPIQIWQQDAQFELYQITIASERNMTIMIGYLYA